MKWWQAEKEVILIVVLLFVLFIYASVRIAPTLTRLEGELTQHGLKTLVEKVWYGKDGSHAN